jgi:hypothetical protein
MNCQTTRDYVAGDQLINVHRSASPKYRTLHVVLEDALSSEVGLWRRQWQLVLQLMMDLTAPEA